MAGIALVASTLLYALGHIGGPALFALAVLQVLLIVLAERIHWLECTVLGEGDDGVHIRTHYWRRPEVAGAVLAVALVTVRLAQGPGPGETALLVMAMVAGAAVMRRPHARAWRASGSQWTEEWWRDREGRRVRQLHLEADPPAVASRPDYPLYRRRVVLALHSSAARVEALVAVGAPGEWARQRRSEARGPGPEVQHQGDGPMRTTRWFEGSSDGVVHAPEPEAIARTLYRDTALRIELPVGEGVRERVVFAHEGDGSRGRLRRFMAAATARATGRVESETGGE